MEARDLKRWHWAVVGIIMGLGLSFACSNVDWDGNLRTLGQTEFEQGLTAPPSDNTHIFRVLVLPAVDGRNTVICWRSTRTSDPRVTRHPTVAYLAAIPFKSELSQDSFPTVMEYLKLIKWQTNTKLAYSYAWYRQTWAVYTLCTGASLLLIGGIWPILLSLLTGGGLGLGRGSADEHYDLSRFGKGEESGKAAGAGGVTAADLDEVAKLGADMEQQLSADAAAASADAAPDAGQTQAVTPLSSESSEQVPTQQEELEREYGGEYYPVVRSVHAKKQDSE